MSFTEILDELPRLTSKERRQPIEKVFELGGDWIDCDDALESEEKKLVQARMEAHDREPKAAGLCQEAKARLQARFT